MAAYTKHGYLVSNFYLSQNEPTLKTTVMRILTWTWLKGIINIASISECPQLKWMCHILNKGKVKQDIRACSPCRRQDLSWIFSVKCILDCGGSARHQILIQCYFNMMYYILKNDAFVWAKYGWSAHINGLVVFEALFYDIDSLKGGVSKMQMHSTIKYRTLPKHSCECKGDKTSSW